MEHSTQKLGKVIKIDESAIENHLDKVVRITVDENLNQFSCSMPKLIVCAMLRSISALKPGETLEPVNTNVNSIPGWAK